MCQGGLPILKRSAVWALTGPGRISMLTESNMLPLSQTGRVCCDYHLLLLFYSAAGKYEDALQQYDLLRGSKTFAVVCGRALCYFKTGNLTDSRQGTLVESVHQCDRR